MKTPKLIELVLGLGLIGGGNAIAAPYPPQIPSDGISLWDQFVVEDRSYRVYIDNTLDSF